MTLECELLDRDGFGIQADARLAVFDFIEGWYNPRRRHSALDYLSPLMYEQTAGIDDRPVPSGATIDQGGAISVSPLRGGPVTIPKAIHRPPNPGNSKLTLRSQFVVEEIPQTNRIWSTAHPNLVRPEETSEVLS